MTSPTLLLIDDDAAARRMMRRMLDRRGYAVIEAADGRSGWEQALHAQPAAVLLDLRMPGELSGADVAQLLRGDQRTAHMRIIIVSATTHLEVMGTATCGICDAYVEKPVDFAMLDGVLAQLAPITKPPA